ncbi:MAG: molybdate ABC transporter permease subunit [Acidithiobacillus sp.]
MDLFDHLAPLWLTLKVATLATGLALTAGVGVGWLLARKRFWGREWLDALASLPLVMPPTVLGYYLIVMLGHNGWLGHWLHAKLHITLMFTWQGAVIAAAVSALPLVLKSARAAIEGVDTRLEQAARVLGAAEIAVAWTVTLPLAVRGIVAGTLLAYARAMGEYGATLMIAGDIPGRTQTLSMAVFDAVQTGDDHLANTLVFIISAACVLILVGASQLLKPRYE